MGDLLSEAEWLEERAQLHSEIDTLGEAVASLRRQLGDARARAGDPAAIEALQEEVDDLKHARCVCVCVEGG